jgi:hypothetical protein
LKCGLTSCHLLKTHRNQTVVSQSQPIRESFESPRSCAEVALMRQLQPVVFPAQSLKIETVAAV